MKMIKKLEETGFAVEREYPGIYYVKGRALFDTQIVVIRELSGAEHSGLKILGLDAREEDIVRFLEKAGGFRRQGDRNNADAVLQVSVQANQKIYQKIRRKTDMCEALRELMKDDIEAEIDRKVREGTEAAKKEVETLKKEAETVKKEAETVKKEAETVKKEAEIVKKELETAKKELETVKKDTCQSDLMNLMKNTGWTKEKAMQMLGVSFAK